MVVFYHGSIFNQSLLLNNRRLTFVMANDAHWYGLNMLPLYVEMSEGYLEAAMEQLKRLQQALARCELPDNKTLHAMVKFHQTQNENNWVFFEQCKRWRNDNLDDEALRLVARLEKSAAQLEAVNRQILDPTPF